MYLSKRYVASYLKFNAESNKWVIILGDIFLKNYEVRLQLHFPSWYIRHFQV